jgi:transmembrane sensor
MAAGGRATVVENSGRAFVVVLSEGRATFDVHPGGPRRWSIECGLATVEVVGTRFTIDRGEGSVVVSVDHGIVLVRGERVPERAQRLGAGQSLRLDRALPPLAPAAAKPAERAIPATATATAMARRANGVPWRDLVRSHEYRRAYGTLGRGGIERSVRSATPQELLWLADIARLSGHPGDAVLPLRRLIDENPRDSSAPIALFTLGRIQLDSLGDSLGAADSFARAIAAGVPRSLGEDAAARLVEAYARAGDVAAAHAAAERYLGTYPDGRSAADVRRWAAAR